MVNGTFDARGAHHPFRVNVLKAAVVYVNWGEIGMMFPGDFEFLVGRSW